MPRLAFSPTAIIGSCNRQQQLAGIPDIYFPPKKASRFSYRAAVEIKYAVSLSWLFPVNQNDNSGLILVHHKPGGSRICTRAVKMLLPQNNLFPSNLPFQLPHARSGVCILKIHKNQPSQHGEVEKNIVSPPLRPVDHNASDSVKLQ